MARIEIYTDGAALGNPGRGGYGIVMIKGDYRKEFSAAYQLTTNNRMELLAVIEAMEKLKRPGLEATVYSDSKYVVDSVDKGWVFGWEKKGFNKAKNSDLWKRFLIVFRKHRIQFKWIKGHAGHPLNERCDYLSVQAATNGPWLKDEWYEMNRNNDDSLFIAEPNN